MNTEVEEEPVKAAPKPNAGNDLFAEEEAGEGDQAGACKPYKG